MKNLALLAIFIAIELSLVQSINWQPGNWAMGCDFNVAGNNIGSQNGLSSNCGSSCASRTGCTHFVHVSNQNGGTCYMKKGSVSKNDAIDTGDNSMVCGITKESNSGSQTSMGPQTSKGPQSNSKFPGCSFKWGTDWDGNNKDYSQWDYITFWIGGAAEGCERQPKCTDFNQYWEGDYLKKVKALNKIAVVYGYIIAFEARNKDGLYDCNDPKHPNINDQLCGRGANWIRNNRQFIIDRYKMHAVEMAKTSYLGPDATAIFLIEPDLYQYYHETRQQGGTLTGPYLRSLYDDICKTIKSVLPNAKTSWDISPWAKDMTTYWGYFKDSNYVDFIHTSGGGHKADNQKIDPNNEITYDYMKKLTGKTIISDSGYGVVGNANAAENAPWFNNWDVDARVKDSIVAHTLANERRIPSYRAKLC